MINEKDKIVGYVSKEITEFWKISEQTSKPIIQGGNWAKGHGSKHKKEFKCIYNYHQAIKNIPIILKYPDYFYYNETEKGIEYFKKLEEDVTLVVRITGKKRLYVATIYPTSTTKIENRKNKELELLEPEIYQKYVHTKGN